MQSNTALFLFIIQSEMELLEACNKELKFYKKIFLQILLRIHFPGRKGACGKPHTQENTLFHNRKTHAASLIRKKSMFSRKKAAAASLTYTKIPFFNKKRSLRQVSHKKHSFS